MRTRFAMLASAMLLAAAPAAAQEGVGASPPKEAGWTVPRTEWGDPDLRGMYPLDQVGRTAVLFASEIEGGIGV